MFRRLVPASNFPIVGVVLTAGLVAATADAQDGTSGPDLLGTWLQLEEFSEDPLEKASELVTGGAGGTTIGGSGSGGVRVSGTQGGRQFGGSGPPGAGPPSGYGVPRRELEQLGSALQVLRFEQTDDATLQLTDGSRTTRIFFLDGRAVGDGFGSETRARIEQGVLVVDSERAERGGSRVVLRGGAGAGPARRSQTFTVQPAERPEDVRLEVLTTLLGGGRPQIEFRTVFERVRGGGVVLVPGAGPAEARAPLTSAAPPSNRGPAEVTATIRDDESDGDDDRGQIFDRGSALPPLAGSSARMSDFDRGSNASNASNASDDAPGRRGPAVIRVLPLSTTPGQLVTGRVEIQTLNIDPTIQKVEFLVDGERVGRRVLPPWQTKASLASPPREQVVEVRAYGAGDRLLGSDSMVVNRLDPPFRVRLEKISGDPTYGQLDVQVRVSVPRAALLRDVQLFRNQELLQTLPSKVTDSTQRGAESIERFGASLEVSGAGPTDFVRVLARLDDGRELEDVRLIEEATRPGSFAETLDVQLVRLQVLAVDKRGVPVTDLEPSDFEVVDGGEVRPVETVTPSRDVDLQLGLAIDSSGSMVPVWNETLRLSAGFLDQTLARRDRGFVVDFDSTLRLVQPLTGSKEALVRSFDRLSPDGGTVLYDSVLFSLLQFGRKGRKALVVFTDGFDGGSRADPKRAVEFGERLGVPVYVIALTSRRGPVPMGRGGRGGAGALALAESTARANLRLITDPTGGRLFQVVSMDQVRSVFAQIQDELRQQLVITYTTDRDPLEPLQPRVRVRRKGVKVRAALPIELTEE